jgi:hypothetical protein
MEGTVVRGRRCIVREEDDAADRWGRSASERERERERDWQVGLACQRERGGEHAGGFVRGSGPANGSKGGSAGASGGGGGGVGGGEAAAAWARFGPARGRAFSFSFYFL